VFGSRISTKSLAMVCRSLGTMLHSGIALTKAFELASGKLGDLRCREALDGVRDGIARGDDVATAMRAQGNAFPGLVIDMVDVAEQTGALPEILIGLAEHYENNLRLRNTFVTAIAWPMFQLVAAILIIAVLILLLGWIADVRGNEPVDVLGLGLLGPTGAIIWLTATFGTAAGLFVGYQVLARSLQGKQVLDSILMRIPVAGNCMRSFGIARFSWAFYLTQQTGMPITRSLTASLRATANGAFIDAAPQIVSLVRSGETLSDALTAAELFPEDFLHMVRVAETSGTVPEALHRLSPQFEEQARRSLSALTVTLAWGIWGLVAAFIVFFIFRLAMFYVGMLSDAANF
jgi:type IV pilus assembly protein PilC